MSKKSTDKLDVFTRKIVKELPEEKVSLSFSKNVMASINALEVNETKVYKPLISKKVWFVIISSFIGLIIYGWKLIPEDQEGYLSEMSNINIGDILNYSPFDLNFKVSNITVYSFVFLALMISIQIIYFKHRIDKQYE
ncbi:hypothetical protein [Urechidicola croceus]|uniref:Uncharacterized protein n=1 Tax=Urechidicola croceus TaxID=1850246 RepID=A0A1D8PBA5_9FLAO|nr:hypothetical protein [Urechidicola croceus]AOW21854.1 hypothetical protein LPB138_14685 [Urechidicola croceus]